MKYSMTAIFFIFLSMACGSESSNSEGNDDTANNSEDEKTCYVGGTWEMVTVPRTGNCDELFGEIITMNIVDNGNEFSATLLNGENDVACSEEFISDLACTGTINCNVGGVGGVVDMSFSLEFDGNSVTGELDITVLIAELFCSGNAQIIGAKI